MHSTSAPTSECVMRLGLVSVGSHKVGAEVVSGQSG